MAPEQAQGQPVDARTDLFSLGTVLYEMATGRRAFGGDDIPLIVMKIINGIVVPPRAINESVPPTLDAIILKLMAVDPRQRYQIAPATCCPISTRVARSWRRGRGPRTQATRSRSPGHLRSGGSPAGRGGRRPGRAGVAASASGRRARPPTLTDRDSIVIGHFENATRIRSSTTRW